MIREKTLNLSWSLTRPLHSGQVPQLLAKEGCGRCSHTYGIDKNVQQISVSAYIHTPWTQRVRSQTRHRPSSPKHTSCTRAMPTPFPGC